MMQESNNAQNSKASGKPQQKFSFVFGSSKKHQSKTDAKQKREKGEEFTRNKDAVKSPNDLTKRIGLVLGTDFLRQRPATVPATVVCQNNS